MRAALSQSSGPDSRNASGAAVPYPAASGATLKTMKTESKKIECKAISTPPQHRGILSPGRVDSPQGFGVRNGQDRLGPHAALPQSKFKSPSTGSAQNSKFLVLLFLLLLPSPGRTGTLTGTLRDLQLNTLTTPLTFYPTNAVLVTGSGLSAGPALTIYPTNGVFSTVLDAGPYTVCLQLNTWRKCFHLDMPAGTNSYNITNLISPRILADQTGGALLADP